MSEQHRDMLGRRKHSEETSFNEQLQALHMKIWRMEEAAKPKPDPIPLRLAKERAERELANPKFVEEWRQFAWGSLPVSTYPKSRWEGGWPDGVTAESFIRGREGLTPDGTALLGQAAPPEPEPVKTFLDDAIARVVGKT
jgi:hypothetical protein